MKSFREHFKERHGSYPDMDNFPGETFNDYFEVLSNGFVAWIEDVVEPKLQKKDEE